MSGYNSDNVHVFDLCGGGFDGLLDSGGRLDGTQAVRRVGNHLFVASEENNRVVRYQAATLDFVDIFADTTAVQIPKPTSLAADASGDLYVAGFDTPAVAKLDGSTGELLQRWDLTGQISGIDAGMIVDQRGRLLLPGFNSSNVIAIDLAGGGVSELISAGSGGLNAARVIHEDPDRNRLLVTGWRSNRVHAFSYDGDPIEDVIVRANPSGLDLDADGNILLTSDQQARVIRYSPTGEQLDVVVDVGEGGILGATFLQVSGSQQGVSLAQADQSWLIGVGTFTEQVLTAELVITDGARFGADFDPAAVQRIAWGSVEFELTGCDSAEYRWSSLDAAYGTGGYPVLRIAPNLASASCASDGLDSSAAQGTWFGGAERDGEGLLIDVLDAERAVITVYTYRP
ncbi:MAG: hypothetical protein AAGA23_02080 [Pseudomonadota bacterium]